LQDTSTALDDALLWYVHTAKNGELQEREDNSNMGMNNEWEDDDRDNG
jgi:hypothetical protein